MASRISHNAAQLATQASIEDLFHFRLRQEGTEFQVYTYPLDTPPIGVRLPGEISLALFEPQKGYEHTRNRYSNHGLYEQDGHVGNIRVWNIDQYGRITGMYFHHAGVQAKLYNVSLHKRSPARAWRLSRNWPGPWQWYTRMVTAWIGIYVPAKKIDFPNETYGDIYPAHGQVTRVVDNGFGIREYRERRWVAGQSNVFEHEGKPWYSSGIYADELRFATGGTNGPRPFPLAQLWA